MKGIHLHFESLSVLSIEIEQRTEEQELTPQETDLLRDGEWLLTTLHVGEDSISVAGQAVDRGHGTQLTFEGRDWQKIVAFAEGRESIPSVPPSCRGCEPRLSAPPGSSVLIVDDDPGIRTVVSALLRSTGFSTTSVDSAEAALAALRGLAPDLLLLDWNLPGMSGIDLCRHLRQERAYRSLPVLFLTANSSVDDVVTAFRVGADDFVCKPFRAPELGARVLGLLRRARSEAPTH